MKLFIWHLKVCGGNFAHQNKSKTHIEMKKLLYFIIVMMMLTFQAVAQKSTTPSQGIKLEITQYRTHKTGVHRAPMHVNIEAFYNAESNFVDISYDGENEGEVFVFWGENLVGYDSTINTTIQLPYDSGQYCLEIISETWIAQGFISL